MWRAASSSAKAQQQDVEASPLVVGAKLALGREAHRLVQAVGEAEKPLTSAAATTGAEHAQG
ncbi:MAG: hypothetical protein R3F39_20385 [Myxococcota bacterium]